MRIARIMFCFFFVATLAVSDVVDARAESTPPREGEYSDGDANACLDCHETESVMGILETKHADVSDRDSPAAQKQCQSCHGPSAKHMLFPMQVENLHFGAESKIAAAQQNTQCLECHDDGEREDWNASAHGFENVLCSNCHQIHDPKTLLLQDQAVTMSCTDGCHTDLMGDSKATDFTHPIGHALHEQDPFTCSTCHNPHGSLVSTRCGDCHEADKATLAEQSPKAQRFHEVATKRGTACIRCHKGLSHPISPVELEAEQQAIEGHATP